MYRKEGEKSRLICGKMTLPLQLSVVTEIKTILISSLKSILIKKREQYLGQDYFKSLIINKYSLVFFPINDI